MITRQHDINDEKTQEYAHARNENYENRIILNVLYWPSRWNALFQNLFSRKLGCAYNCNMLNLLSAKRWKTDRDLFMPFGIWKENVLSNLVVERKFIPAMKYLERLCPWREGAERLRVKKFFFLNQSIENQSYVNLGKVIIWHVSVVEIQDVSFWV